jgi:hypothetical protein
LVVKEAKDWPYFEQEISGVAGFGVSDDNSSSLMMETYFSERNQTDFSFSLYLSDASSSLGAHLQIGGYDLDKYSDGEKFKYIPAVVSSDQNGGWKVKVKSIESGGNKLGKSKFAHFTSGVSGIYGPKSQVDEIWNSMVGYVECDPVKTDTGEEMLACGCKGLSPNSVLPKITFNFNGLSLDLLPEHYTVVSGDYCIIPIIKSKS